MRSTEKARDSVIDLWSATEQFTSARMALLELHPALRGRDSHPLILAYAAIHRPAVAVPKTTLEQLRVLDKAFFGQADQLGAAIATIRKRADDRRARAADGVRGLDYLAPYEQGWRDVGSAQEMARRFAAIADSGIVELGDEVTPVLARLAVNRAIRVYANDLAAAYRALNEQRRVLYEWGFRLAPVRHAPPWVPDVQWPVASPGEALDADAESGTWLGDYRVAVAAWLAETWRTVLAPYLASREAQLLGWQQQVAEVRGRATDDLVRATGLVAEVDKASDALDRLRGERDTWHAPDGVGLTPATRAALSEVRAAARDVVGDPWLRDRLAMLSSGGDVDVCIPVVATMKAGKSTTLGTLLGLDVAPRRSHTMTTLATRYMLSGTVREAELSLGDAITSDYARLLARIRARLPDSEPSLSPHPYLARFAARLLLEEEWPPQRCDGTRAVFDTLSFLNDFARVAMLLLPPDEIEPLTGWVPEVLVPVGDTARSSTDTRLRLTLVDTPGLGEAMGRDLLPVIVGRTLDHADACVTDYTQLNSEATAALAAQVSKRFGTRTGSAVWVTVNRIDQRRSSADLDEEGVRGAVRQLLGLPDRAVPVVETWAELALAVVGCEGSPTPERLGSLLALADPHGSRFSREETPDLEDVARLIRLATRRSGLGALRAVVLEDLARRGATLSVEAVIERLTSTRRERAKQLGRAVEDLRWALAASFPAKEGLRLD